MAEKLKTAVYSGSFNPMHIGHLAIIRHLTERSDIEKILLIVSPKNPIKDSVSADSAKARYEAALEAVRRHFPSENKIKVDDIELQMAEPHYSIRTLEALEKREPGSEFIFVMGADSLAGIRRWRDYQRILTEFSVAVYPRDGFETTKIKQDLLSENPAYKIHILDAPLVTVSSSQIRQAIRRNEDISDLIV